jgi:cyclophilin family peptidyl-prolyl cis-trans isomerase/HEAT repeat protein
VRRAGFAGLVVVVGVASLGPAHQPSARLRRSAEPLRAKAEAGRYTQDIRPLVDASRTGSADTRNAAIRALGRLERRDVITELLPFLAADETRAETANALAQALGGSPLDRVPQGQQEQVVLEALLVAGATELARNRPLALTSVARSLGRLPYTSPDQVRAAEAFLRRVLELPFPLLTDEPHAGAARGLESLARLSRKLAILEDETIDRLRRTARTRSPNRTAQQRNALAALIAAQGVDAETLTVALNDDDVEVRRQAVLSLAGSGSVVADGERAGFIRQSLSDRSFMVRYEAVRAWTRRAVKEHGCQPLLDALNDQSLHVVLVAMDALGDQCLDEQDITDRVTSEARTPPPTGKWQREAHAFLALAKRSPDRADVAMTTFAMHTNWQVRMYAARAAAILEDVPMLTRLAADPEDNVADAALPALRKRIGSDSDGVFIAALGRPNRTISRGEPARPYQIILTAATALKGAQPTPALATALQRALERISAENCETSRDVRVALIDRLGELGSIAQQSTLVALLEDVDPKVAERAAAALNQWTGKVWTTDSPARAQRDVPTSADVAQQYCARVEMAAGRTFQISFHGDQAPLARQRFLTLARRGYYDNLTFHRVVPNFVIQGGSPGANEYCGDCPFMRDEVGLLMHLRGTVGISTRGRDTGDAQIFINLVDNARLDHIYTVFGFVPEPGMSVVDDIQEGDRISRVTILAGPTCRR